MVEGSRWPIRAGQEITILITASAAQLISVFADVIDDRGHRSVMTIQATAHPADRTTTQFWSTKSSIQRDGWITSLQVGHGVGAIATKRGQVYVQVYVQRSDLPTLSQVLARGYVYSGHEVTLGENVEPGPGGGEGFFLLNPVQASGILDGDFIVDFLTPTNSVRFIHELRIRATATATVGTRNFRVNKLDEDGVETYRIGDSGAVTASQTFDEVLAPFLTASITGAGANVEAIDLLAEPLIFLEGETLRVQDINNIEANDTVVFFGKVEEWLVI